MATAMPRPTESRPLPALRAGSLRAARRVPRWLLRARLLRDPFLLYTAALAPIALIVALIARNPRDLAMVAILTPFFIGAQVVLAVVPPRARPLTPFGWSFLRLAVTFLFVAGLAELVGGRTQPLAALYIPVIVAAAALGTVQAAVMGALAALIYLAPEIALPGSGADVALRGVTLAGVSILVAVGTRRLVIAVEQAAHQLRAAVVSERRRSRQIAGMEAVSRVLVTGGPTAEMLHGALGVLVDQFHYHYVSIYLADQGKLMLGAQRGYQGPPASFDGTKGVIGRVMRSHELAFVLDVAHDPDYVAVYDEVVSEICAPLIDDGQFLGVLNVEARQPSTGPIATSSPRSPAASRRSWPSDATVRRLPSGSQSSTASMSSRTR